MTPEIYQDRAGQWRYRFRARNGRILVWSEGYTRKASARRAVENFLYDAAKLWDKESIDVVERDEKRLPN